VPTGRPLQVAQERGGAAHGRDRRDARQWDVGGVVGLGHGGPQRRVPALRVAPDRGATAQVELRDATGRADGVQHGAGLPVADQVRLHAAGAEPRVVGRDDRPAALERRVHGLDAAGADRVARAQARGAPRPQTRRPVRPGDHRGAGHELVARDGHEGAGHGRLVVGPSGGVEDPPRPHALGHVRREGLRAQEQAGGARRVGRRGVERVGSRQRQRDQRRVAGQRDRDDQHEPCPDRGRDEALGTREGGQQEAHAEQDAHRQHRHVGPGHDEQAQQDEPDPGGHARAGAATHALHARGGQGHREPVRQQPHAPRGLDGQDHGAEQEHDAQDPATQAVARDDLVRARDGQRDDRGEQQGVDAGERPGDEQQPQGDRHDGQHRSGAVGDRGAHQRPR